jgi:hypothetical protein
MKNKHDSEGGNAEWQDKRMRRKPAARRFVDTARVALPLSPYDILLPFLVNAAFDMLCNFKVQTTVGSMGWRS